MVQAVGAFYDPVEKPRQAKGLDSQNIETDIGLVSVNLSSDCHLLVRFDACRRGETSKNTPT